METLGQRFGITQRPWTRALSKETGMTREEYDRLVAMEEQYITEAVQIDSLFSINSNELDNVLAMHAPKQYTSKFVKDTINVNSAIWRDRVVNDLAMLYYIMPFLYHQVAPTDSLSIYNILIKELQDIYIATGPVAELTIAHIYPIFMRELAQNFALTGHLTDKKVWSFVYFVVLNKTEDGYKGIWEIMKILHQERSNYHTQWSQIISPMGTSPQPEIPLLDAKYTSASPGGGLYDTISYIFASSYFTACEVVNLLVEMKKNSFKVNNEEELQKLKSSFESCTAPIILILGFQTETADHANIVLIDPWHNILDHFEPLGSDPSFITNVFMQTIFKPFVEDITQETWTYETIASFCPRYVRLGPQKIQETLPLEKTGWCGVWSLYYIDLRLRNPSWEREDIIKYMSTYPHMMQEIRRYKCFVMTYVYELMNADINVYNKLQDYVIIDINKFIRECNSDFWT